MDAALRRDLAALMFRLLFGGLMLFHGVDKIVGGIGWMPGALEGAGLPGVLAYGVYLGEVVAPILLILGIVPEISGALIAFTMLIAVVVAHPGDVLSLGDHGEWAIELQEMYGLGALATGLLGPGRFRVPVPTWPPLPDDEA